MEPRNIRVAKWRPNKAGKYQKERKLDVVYGPINSRRLGLSLGINPIQPTDAEAKPFACNWACVYCQYGAESLDESIGGGKIRFSTLDEIKEGLEKRLSSNEHYDSVTICGPTEPALHPQFDEIVDLAVEMRNTYRPEIATSLFTNATRLKDKNIYSLDFVFMKLDAGNEETFRRFNRARGTSYEQLIDNLKTARIKRKIIQTAVVGGKDGNLDENNLRDYIEQIGEISPDEVHLYPLLYKPFPNFDLRAISEDELEELGKRIRENTDGLIKTFHDPVNIGQEFRF